MNYAKVSSLVCCIGILITANHVKADLELICNPSIMTDVKRSKKPSWTYTNNLISVANQTAKERFTADRSASILSIHGNPDYYTKINELQDCS